MPVSADYRYYTAVVELEHAVAKNPTAPDLAPIYAFLGSFNRAASKDKLSFEVGADMMHSLLGFVEAATKGDEAFEDKLLEQMKKGGITLREVFTRMSIRDESDAGANTSGNVCLQLDVGTCKASKAAWLAKKRNERVREGLIDEFTTNIIPRIEESSLEGMLRKMVDGLKEAMKTKIAICVRGVPTT